MESSGAHVERGTLEPHEREARAQALEQRGEHAGRRRVVPHVHVDLRGRALEAPHDPRLVLVPDPAVQRARAVAQDPAAPRALARR